jgi:hypothetical protein
MSAGTVAPAIRPNKFGGKCAGCDVWIEPAEGRIDKISGRWQVRHAGACPEAASVGVYQLDGRIYVVRPPRSKSGHRYALELVESAPRLTEAGTVIPFDLVRRPGAVFRLTEEHRLSLADANEISAKHGRCFCGAHLYAADTIKKCEQTGLWVGPVCRQRYFPGS